MKTSKFKLSIGVFLNLLVLISLLFSCRTEDEIVPAEEDEIIAQDTAGISGLYLLNEGNMNMNKASLDTYDYESGLYRRNVFGEANPEATLGLGDVGNDIGIYGSQVWVVVNCSNKIEVLRVGTNERIAVIDAKNCRYIDFYNGKAYLTGYDGSVGIEIGGESTPNGYVMEIDTTTHEILRETKVGRQPEQLAILNDKIYVANSGGYSPPNYERTVSVVDINTFTEEKEIDVALNLHQLSADKNGMLWVSSRGDYYETPSDLYVIDPNIDKVIDTIGIACSKLVIDDNSAYVIGSEFSYQTFDYNISYKKIDIDTKEVTSECFLPQEIVDDIDTPYGLAIDPISKYIYITDAGDYLSPGWLWCYDPENDEIVFKHETGDIPSGIAFIEI